jgi:hypothetical protein
MSLLTFFGNLIGVAAAVATAFPNLPGVESAKERWSMYQLKKQVLPRLYWNAILKGFT